MIIYILLATGCKVEGAAPEYFLEGIRINFLKSWHSRSMKLENAVFGIRTNHSCHPIK